MKRVADIITTEGYARHDARGMDFILRLGGKCVRFDPSPRYYQNREGEDRAREFVLQEKLFRGTDVVLFSHFHNDHFGAEFLESADRERDMVAVYPNSFERSRAGLDKKLHRKYDRRMALVKERCASTVEVGYYARWKLNGLLLEFKPFRHSCYKGYDLGDVLTAYLHDGEKGVFFSSDISGPEYDDACEWIIGKDPQLLILDGPFHGIMSVPGKNVRQVKKFACDLEKSYKNFRDIVAVTPNLEKVLVCHHFMKGFPLPDNALDRVPNELRERLRKLKVDHETRGIIARRYDGVEKTISRLLDAADDRDVKIYLPSMIKDGRIRF
ncbi:MAG: hypothetical protein QXD77_00080 [Candidatus Aenigmatarchaeota archaeon]